MPPVTINWYVDYNNDQGDAYTPPGMTVLQARRIPDTGPEFRGSGGASRPAGGARCSCLHAGIEVLGHEVS